MSKIKLKERTLSKLLWVGIVGILVVIAWQFQAPDRGPKLGTTLLTPYVEPCGEDMLTYSGKAIEPCPKKVEKSLDIPTK